jgi:hypothetical protein
MISIDFADENVTPAAAATSQFDHHPALIFRTPATGSDMRGIGLATHDANGHRL